MSASSVLGGILNDRPTDRTFFPCERFNERKTTEILLGGILSVVTFPGSSKRVRRISAREGRPVARGSRGYEYVFTNNEFSANDYIAR